MPEPVKGWGAADLGISFIVCVLLTGGAGYALDSYLATKPWGLLAGLFLGFAAWLWQMWKVFNQQR